MLLTVNRKTVNCKWILRNPADRPEYNISNRERLKKEEVLKIINFNHLRIRTKAIIISVTFLFLAVIFANLIFIDLGKRVLERGVQRRGVSLAKNFAYNVEYGVLIENKTILNGFIEGIMREEDVACASVFDRHGKILNHAGDKRLGSGASRQTLIEKDDIQLNLFKSEDRGFFYEIVLPVKTTGKKMTGEELILLKQTEDKDKDKEIGAVRIVISLAGMEGEINLLIKTILLFSILMVIAGVLLTFFLVKVVLGPIEQLAVATKRISEGDYAPVVEVKSRDEIGELACSFNQMVNKISEKEIKIKEYTNKLEKTVTEKGEVIAELTTTQSQLIQSEKLAGIGILASGVAHEINNPLQGIVSKAGLILRKIDNQDVVRDSANKVKGYAEKMAGIVRELSGYSRDAKIDGNSSVNLNDIIKESLKMASYARNFTDIIIEKKLTDLPLILGNAGQMQQIFVNLITNAVDAMDGKGILSLRTGITPCRDTPRRRKEDKAVLPAAVVFVEVSDDGTGVKEVDLPNIFDPLFTTKEAGKGTGLGLNMVYRLVTKYKGGVKIKTEEGVGTTFRVEFPLK